MSDDDNDERIRKILDEHAREHYDNQLKMTALVVGLFLAVIWFMLRR